MIVIKANGVTDVRRLRKLADTLDAADIPELPAATRAETKEPSVDSEPGPRITPRTRAAILALQPVEARVPGDYETP